MPNENRAVRWKTAKKNAADLIRKLLQWRKQEVATAETISSQNLREKSITIGDIQINENKIHYQSMILTIEMDPDTHWFGSLDELESFVEIAETISKSDIVDAVDSLL